MCSNRVLRALPPTLPATSGRYCAVPLTLECELILVTYNQLKCGRGDTVSPNTKSKEVKQLLF